MELMEHPNEKGPTLSSLSVRSVGSSERAPAHRVLDLTGV